MQKSKLDNKQRLRNDETKGKWKIAIVTGGWWEDKTTGSETNAANDDKMEHILSAVRNEE